MECVGGGGGKDAADPTLQIWRLLGLGQMWSVHVCVCGSRMPQTTSLHDWRCVGVGTSWAKPSFVKENDENKSKDLFSSLNSFAVMLNIQESLSHSSSISTQKMLCAPLFLFSCSFLLQFQCPSFSSLSSPPHLAEVLEVRSAS